jgi:methionyl-tRNA formyltransferase
MVSYFLEGEKVMRIVLFGGTDLTLIVAKTIVEMGCNLVGVVTIGKRFSISYQPSGVDNVRYSDVAEWAESISVPVHYFESNDKVITFVQSLSADFALVAGWYHMLPRSLRACFPKGCAGLHASLLPSYRGGAPLNWAILDGATETGVSLFELGDGVDDGPLYGQERFPIGPRSCIGELVERANGASVVLVQTCLPRIKEGTLTPFPQTGTPSYTLQRIPADGNIDWRHHVLQIDRLIRAVGKPYPGALTMKDDMHIRIWKAEPFPDNGPRILGAPGQIATFPDERFPIVVCGTGSLRILEATTDDGIDVLPVLRKSNHQRLHPWIM